VTWEGDARISNSVLTMLTTLVIMLLVAYGPSEEKLNDTGT